MRPSPAPPASSTPPPAVRRILIDDSADGQRLDNFLIGLLKGVPKTHVYRVIRSGEVRVNSSRAGADTRLAAGDEVRVPPVRVPLPEHDASTAPPREFTCIHEDDHLLAIDKPAGVAVHGGSGVAFGVIEQVRRARPEARFLELVHRLDRDTSGLLLIAKRRSALLALQDQFRQRSMDKRYVALVHGAWPASLKVLDIALRKTSTAEGERRVHAVDAEHADAQRAISLVRVVSRLAASTLLDVTLKTGRTHQIRVHLATSGHPIVGDDKYGDDAVNAAYARGTAAPGLRFGRMFLHARSLRLAHPATGEPLLLEAPLPDDCCALLARLAPAAPLADIATPPAVGRMIPVQE